MRLLSLHKAEMYFTTLMLIIPFLIISVTSFRIIRRDTDELKCGLTSKTPASSSESLD
ncbi:hypothetical protein EJ05DRAFT_472435 [Pseudovirgaria hyperparasitica]|uniref:Uncharacterized protein n=1 Tax=Pseudovirgaria hyperparasitica TaxID=470096 RepID=A0A6A6WMU1_9PEZI|nr:uncharacterized protein EJ05DRAFT_472435 [Pseudovirgaria hyperparasitica]KAF2763540.1 hypothetical protein EJ05DRAFT_472435 [Pseudovirgaria hyperparasitica]